MKIKIIYDNCKASHEFQEDWGFSALVETNQHRLLSDTGNNRDIFFSNLEKMNINLEEITSVVFSHKHPDHIAGCEEILQKLQKNTNVYLPKGFPLKKIPQEHVQSQVIKKFHEIGDNIFCMPLRGGFFWHEQSLVLKTDKGLVILTGCAHPGVIRIIEKAKQRLNQPVHLILGGFHLFDKSERFIDDIVHQTNALQVKKVAPCHCSGPQAIRCFQELYDKNFYKIGVGTTLTI